MTKWKKYPELENLRRLKNEGRELLGKTIDWTEKRDGQCVSIILDEDERWIISSHNREIAEENIQQRFSLTPEFPKIKDLLITECSQYGKNYIAYGELLLPISPTRVERNKKYIHWILFDIYDLNNERFIPYEQLYQLAYNYKIPVVKRIIQSIHGNMTQLSGAVDIMLKWAKRHRREGVVGKVYSDQIFFKEKHNLPKPTKLERPNKIDLPVMDEHTIMRALQHAFDEVMNITSKCNDCTCRDAHDDETCIPCMEERWRDKKLSMPIIAKHMGVEAREHNFSTPHNMYQIYLNTPIMDIVCNGTTRKNK